VLLAHFVACIGTIPWHLGQNPSDFFRIRTRGSLQYVFLCVDCGKLLGDGDAERKIGGPNACSRRKAARGRTLQSCRKLACERWTSPGNSKLQTQNAKAPLSRLWTRVRVRPAPATILCLFALRPAQCLEPACGVEDPEAPEFDRGLRGLRGLRGYDRPDPCCRRKRSSFPRAGIRSSDAEIIEPHGPNATNSPARAAENEEAGVEIQHVKH
jgi:hypothetical protein